VTPEDGNNGGTESQCHLCSEQFIATLPTLAWNKLMLAKRERIIKTIATKIMNKNYRNEMLRKISKEIVTCENCERRMINLYEKHRGLELAKKASDMAQNNLEKAKEDILKIFVKEPILNSASAKAKVSSSSTSNQSTLWNVEVFISRLRASIAESNNNKWSTAIIIC